jgi:hypothetical protein
MLHVFREGPGFSESFSILYQLELTGVHKIAAAASILSTPLTPNWYQMQKRYSEKPLSSENMQHTTCNNALFHLPVD